MNTRGARDLPNGEVAARYATLTLLCTLLLAVSGCGSTAPQEVEDDETLSYVSAADIAAALRARGALVEEKGENVMSLFTVPGRELRVNGARVDVFRFASGTEASAEVPRLTESLIHWADPARLYRTGPLLILHAGREPALLSLLEAVLGAPVATVG